MAQFDKDNIMNMQTDAPMDTDFVPVPEGEYQASIDKVEGRVVGSGGDKPVIDITWGISDPSIVKVTGIERPTVRQTVFLDISPSGGLDLGKGKNIQLGRLRSAAGQNGAGPWAPGMLVGSVAIVKVSHRQYEGRTFAEVKNVAAIS